jgi:hypothetical protein
LQEKEMVNNIQQLARVMVQLGDLHRCAAELSTLFVQCLSTMSVQAPIIATVLALISREDHEFGSLVTKKLGEAFLHSLSDGECVCISVCGVFVCLFCCQVVGKKM